MYINASSDRGSPSPLLSSAMVQSWFQLSNRRSQIRFVAMMRSYTFLQTNLIFVAASASKCCQFRLHFSHLCWHPRCEIHKECCSFLGLLEFFPCDWGDYISFPLSLMPIKLKTAWNSLKRPGGRTWSRSSNDATDAVSYLQSAESAALLQEIIKNPACFALSVSWFLREARFCASDHLALFYLSFFIMHISVLHKYLVSGV